MPPSVVFYISSHGFGHAVREIEVIRALHARRADVPVNVRSAAPRWLFERNLDQPVAFHAIECDTGVVQIDSLRLDEDRTIARAAAFHCDLPTKAAAESAFLRQAHAALVVGDIPPLAFAAAALADVPALAIANFTWDWIYEGYPDSLATAPDLVPVIRHAYATAALALRLPMWGGWGCFDGKTRDIPFIARRARHEPADVRRTLGLPGDRPLVLVSFGGYGLDGIDLDALGRASRYTFVLTFAGEAEGWPAATARHIVRIDERALYAHGFRYQDLVAAVDVVATKPGYGIIADCLANDAALLYTSRGRFREYDALVAALPSLTRSAFISQEDLFAGRWGEHLDRLLSQPRPLERPATNGADVAAETILGFVR